jgi:uncharacterized protein (UPF0218 family)
MGVEYVLTPELREELKKPLGRLIKGSFSQTMKELKEMVARDRPPIIISVGDTVSKNLQQFGFHPKVTIIDNKCMRKNTQGTKLPAERVVYVQNPQGTLTKEAIMATQGGMESKQSIEIVVDGEEDLLALIAIVYAPENGYIVYGQPHEGIVVVKATLNKKEETAAILRIMKECSKN